MEENQNLLENTVMEYFHNFRVGKGGKDLPRRATIELYKSFLKNILKKRSNNQVDLTDSIRFPKFTEFYKGFLKKLKLEGKGNTRRNKKFLLIH